MSPRQIAKTLAGVGIAALVVIVAAAVLIIKSRERERELLAQSVKVEPGSLLHARNFHWTQMKGDKEQWELFASEANYSDDRTSLTLKDSKISMVMEDGKPLSATAKQVSLKLTGNNHVNLAHLSGGVVVHYGDITITTQNGTFLPDSDLLTATGPVEIIGQGFKVVGVGLSAKPKARIFTIEHQVVTDFTAGAVHAAAASHSS
jgi:LPS export ABC transporter protein LptC